MGGGPCLGLWSFTVSFSGRVAGTSAPLLDKADSDRLDATLLVRAIARFVASLKRVWPSIWVSAHSPKGGQAYRIVNPGDLFP